MKLQLALLTLITFFVVACGMGEDRTEKVTEKNITNVETEKPTTTPTTSATQCPEQQVRVEVQTIEKHLLCFRSCAGNSSCLNRRGINRTVVKTITNKWGRKYDCYAM